MTFWETVERGEYIMIALAVLFIISICIWWVRAAKLSNDRRGYGQLIQRVRDHVSEGDVDNADQICSAGKTPGARVLCIGIRRIGQPMPEVRASMAQAAELETISMQQGAGWLRAIAVLAPLLGLTGTLVGVIDRLRDLGEGGIMTDISMVCAEIAPTIVTTVAGLGVGIFSLVAFTCLSSSIASAQRSLGMLQGEFTHLLNSPS